MNCLCKETIHLRQNFSLTFSDINLKDMKYKSPGRLFVPFLALLPNHNTGLCPTSPFPPTFTASSPTQGFNILPTPLSPFSRSTPKPAASNNVCHVKVSILPLELYSCQISRMLNIISFHCIMVCNYDTS